MLHSLLSLGAQENDFWAACVLHAEGLHVALISLQFLRRSRAVLHGLLSLGAQENDLWTA